jgi:hypothetical protein
MSRSLPALLLVALTAFTAGCDLPRAHGDANAIIVATDEDSWFEVEEAIRTALEPTIQTVREERPFRLTHQDPNISDHWGSLRRFRQVVAVGTRDDFWVAEALEAHPEGADATAPGILQVRSLWARDQLVTVVLLPETGKPEAVAHVGDSLFALMDRQYRDWARNRMFVSGRNEALADSLRTSVGFSLLFPNVYRYSVQDSVFRFRNDNPSPTERIREVAVTWRSPVPEEDPTREELAEWRVRFTQDYYVNPQVLDTMIVSYGEISVDGVRGVELQSAWANPPDRWVAGGPFIVRALRCPEQDRLYLMDAWLYAPGQDKYEYMIQLQTILNSFRCE